MWSFSEIVGSLCHDGEVSLFSLANLIRKRQLHRFEPLLRVCEFDPRRSHTTNGYDSYNEGEHPFPCSAFALFWNTGHVLDLFGQIGEEYKQIWAARTVSMKHGVSWISRFVCRGQSISSHGSLSDKLCRVNWTTVTLQSRDS